MWLINVVRFIVWGYSKLRASFSRVVSNFVTEFDLRIRILNKF